MSGTLTVVFDQPYPATGTMQIQSHSGDGDAGDLVTTAVGPGECGPVPSTTPGNTTTTVAKSKPKKAPAKPRPRSQAAASRRKPRKV